jgi:hypothetical protein
MFKNLFKKKSELEVLMEKYQALLKESHRLSLINRTQSDAVWVEAEKIADQIEILRQK